MSTDAGASHLREALRDARRLLRGSKGTYVSLLLCVLSATLHFVLGFAVGSTQPGFAGSVVAGVVVLVVMAPLWGGMYHLDLARLQGHEVRAAMVFEELPNATSHMVVQLVLGIVPVVACTMAGTRPGLGLVGEAGVVVVLLTWTGLDYWAPFFVVDRKLSAFDAIKQSIAFGLRHFGKFFLANLAAALLLFVSTIPLLLGLVWTVPLTRIAFAALYRQRHPLLRDYTPAAPDRGPAAA